MENPIKMDDLGVPLFLETPIYSQLLFCPWWNKVWLTFILKDPQSLFLEVLWGIPTPLWSEWPQGQTSWFMLHKFVASWKRMQAVEVTVTSYHSRDSWCNLNRDENTRVLTVCGSCSESHEDVSHRDYSVWICVYNDHLSYQIVSIS